MSVPDPADPLHAALSALAALGTEQDQDAIGELQSRLAGQCLRVLVAGEAKRGKSTLVNALLGRPVLPVGVTPLTALATTVRRGAPDGLPSRHCRSLSRSRCINLTARFALICPFTAGTISFEAAV